MSDTDSFIDEVTEEVRRDRLFGLMRRYGWIAVLAVLLLVGGAAWNEWRKAQERSAAEALGDSVLAALQQDEQAARAEALAAIEAPNASSQAMIDLLAAAEQEQNNPAAAAERLIALADNSGAKLVYRQIATLKATAMPDSGLSEEDRRTRLEGLALSGGLTGLLAEEQLAWLDVETGQTEAALERMQGIAVNASATPGLRQRASQVIVALGGTLPEDADSAEE
ncbi:tetratricopeptide repeat protein [Roseovarius sp. 2305UL8-3]|uniref:tetratricopeptide repeat protein n=1 Tax=Roseovarius conchicola TaxID=3121636 RepID=UPI003529907B